MQGALGNADIGLGQKQRQQTPYPVQFVLSLCSLLRESDRDIPCRQAVQTVTANVLSLEGIRAGSVDRRAPHGRHRSVAPPACHACFDLRLISILAGDYGGRFSRLVAECEEATGIGSGKNGGGEFFSHREAWLTIVWLRTAYCVQVMPYRRRAVRRKCLRGFAMETQVFLSEN